ncbi:hypothetical protein [Candidatus Phytoplasma oryzae]|nr:hypothetical protein PIE28_01395 [Candidatus Phytoplasma oryzae]
MLNRKKIDSNLSFCIFLILSFLFTIKLFSPFKLYAFKDSISSELDLFKNYNSLQQERVIDIISKTFFDIKKSLYKIQPHETAAIENLHTYAVSSALNIPQWTDREASHKSLYELAFEFDPKFDKKDFTKEMISKTVQFLVELTLSNLSSENEIDDDSVIAGFLSEIQENTKSAAYYKKVLTDNIKYFLDNNTDF